MDKWHDVGHDLSSRQKGLRAERTHFFLLCTLEKIKERKGKAKGFFPQSSDFRRSEFFKPRVKVYLLGEGYVCVLEKRYFAKDPREEFWGNRGLGSAHEAS